MHSDSRSNTSLRFVFILLFTAGAWAQQLPDGPGKAETEKVCSHCHELARSIVPRQGKEGWQQTMDKMVALGAEVTDKDYNAIVEYLAKNYPAEAMPKLNANKATTIEFESRLSLLRSQAAALVRHREQNGPFKSVEDMKKVPGVDAAKIEAKKDQLLF